MRGLKKTVVFFLGIMFTSCWLFPEENSEMPRRTKLEKNVIRRDLDRKLESQFAAIPDNRFECRIWKQDTQKLINNLQSSGATVSAAQSQQELDCVVCDDPLESKLDFLMASCSCDVIVTRNMLAADGSFIIDAPGTYCFDTNIMSNGTFGIMLGISANDVVIDLRGHSVETVVDTNTAAVSIPFGVSRVTICNGIIRSSEIGIRVDPVDNAFTDNLVVKNIQFIDNIDHLLIDRSNFTTIKDSLFDVEDNRINIDNVINITQSNEINLKNCIIRSQNIFGKDGVLVNFANCSHIQIDAVEIYNNVLGRVNDTVSLIRFDKSNNIQVGNASFCDNQVAASAALFLRIDQCNDVKITRSLFEGNRTDLSVTPGSFILLNCDEDSQRVMIDNSSFSLNDGGGVGEIISDGLGGAAIHIGSATDFCITNNIFLNNRFVQNPSAIINISSESEGRGLLQNNKIVGNDLGSEDVSPRIIQINNSSFGDCVVRNNLIEDNDAQGNLSGIFAAGTFAAAGRGSLIEGNVVRNNGSNANTSIGIDTANLNSVISNVVSGHVKGISVVPVGGPEGVGVFSNCVYNTKPGGTAYDIPENMPVAALTDTNTQIGCWTNVHD